MKALVTGSTGFLGSTLCHALIAAGHEVRAFHRSSSVLRQLEGLPVEHVIGDLTQPDTLTAALEGIELVFHTAAPLNPAGQPGRMYAVTVEGTRNVLQAAQRAGVRRVIHTSSIAALGAPIPPRRSQDIPAPIDELHTWNLPPERWPFGYAKYLAELEVERACARGLDCVIVNPGLIIGAGDIYRQTSALVVLSAQGKLTASIEGGLNVVHIDDVILGHLAAAERGKTGERYILGGHNLTLHTLLKTIAQITGAPLPRVQIPARVARLAARPVGWLSPFLPIAIDPGILYLAGYYFYVSTRKAQMELLLPPPRALEKAIQDAVDWFRQMRVIPSSPDNQADLKAG